MTNINGIANRIISVLQLTRRAELWVLLAVKCLPPMYAVKWLAREWTLEYIVGQLLVTYWLIPRPTIALHPPTLTSTLLFQHIGFAGEWALFRTVYHALP